MNHCYIIKIWNCVHMNKVKKLNDYDFEFFSPVYHVLYNVLLCLAFPRCAGDYGCNTRVASRFILYYVHGVGIYIICLPMYPRLTPPHHYIIIIIYYFIIVVSDLSFLVLRIMEPTMRFSCKNHTKRSDYGVLRGWCLPS